MTNPGWGGGAPEPQDPRSSPGSDPWAQPPQAPGHGQAPQNGGGQGAPYGAGPAPQFNGGPGAQFNAGQSPQYGGGQSPQPGSAPWQGPATSPAQPSPAGQQPSPGYGSPAYGAPSGPGGFGPSGPGGFGPSGPGGPGGFGPTGPTGEQPPSKRTWPLLVGAIACIGALVLAVAGGIGFLALNNRGGGDPTAQETTATSEEPTSEDPTTEETTEEGSDFEVIPAYDRPPGTPEELAAILADNPLTAGDLPDIGTCDLPPTPPDATAEQLQAVLDASAGCLNQVWSAASSDRGLPWRNPTVTVYEYPTLPNSSCADNPDNFGADFATVCNLDTSIYWPLGYGTGTDFTDENEVAQAYLWDLSYSYTNTLMWNSSLTVYYVTMMNQFQDSGDSEAYDEAFIRWDLQRSCLTTAALGQLPTAAQPSGAFRDGLLDEATWPEQGDRPVTSSTRVLWLRNGLESGGDLSACNTWVAPVDQVT